MDSSARPPSRARPYRALLLLAAFVLCGRVAIAQDLMAQATVSPGPPAWSYTLFNQEASTSTFFVGTFTLAVDAPVTVTGSPVGWTADTDGLTSVTWDADPSGAYDIAPGGSLSGFQISSPNATSTTQDDTIVAFDHSGNASARQATGGILSPSLAPVPEPSPLLVFGLGSFVLLGRLRRARRS